METNFRWGILGTGAIARQFADGLRVVPDAELVAVGSRRAETAAAFVSAYGGTPHASYDALAADPNVDAVYVATPHTCHREDTLRCLREGKAVLCEKPFAINVAETEQMIGAARERGLFLMEAMWTRFNPVMGRVRELLAQGAIGEPRMLTADFGFRAEFDAAGRLFDPELGGGALLDVGIYCVSLAHMVFGGSPEAMTGAADLGATGVDEQSAWVFRYPNGALAVMSSAVRTETPQEAVINGTEGRIRIPAFWHPDRLFVGRGSKEEEHVFEIFGNGYNYEAVEVMQCVRAGKGESRIMTLDQTTAIMRDLDALRGQWGLVYPQERA